MELLGALMYRIAGVKAIVPAEVDMESDAVEPSDLFVASSTRTYALSDCCKTCCPVVCLVLAVDVIADVVGKETRDNVLSFVYMLRCDQASSVRQSALQVCNCDS